MNTLNYNGIIVRFSEIGLKGKNRPMFLRCLAQNIEQALQPFGISKIQSVWGRVWIETDKISPEIIEALQRIFGIASFSPTMRVESDPNTIMNSAETLVSHHLKNIPHQNNIPFRVQTTRGEKRFPLNSMELNREVGGKLLSKFTRLQVNLNQPEITVGIDVRSEGTYLFTEHYPGLKGLPVGVMGKVVSLLSGGIDSPVASYLAMKRGCEVILVSFHSYPFIGQGSIEKVKDLTKSLGRFTPRLKLILVPFADIQKEIKQNTPEEYRTVLYRRMMGRIAQNIAKHHKAHALINGDSIGQVASQTLENISCIDHAVDIPTLRPLVTFDKEETIELAKRIGTFDISIRPEQDCCTLFQPAHPTTRGKIERCVAAEENLDIPGMVENLHQEVETFSLPVRATSQKQIS